MKHLLIGALMVSTLLPPPVSADQLAIKEQLQLKERWDENIGVYNRRAKVLSHCSALAYTLSLKNKNEESKTVYDKTALKTEEMAKGMLVKNGAAVKEAEQMVTMYKNEIQPVFQVLIDNIRIVDEGTQKQFRENSLFCLQFNALSSMKPKV